MENILKFEDFIAINEAKRNYPVTDFIRDMKKLGWTYIDDRGKGHQFNKMITKSDGSPMTLIITSHFHEKDIDPKNIEFAKKMLLLEYLETGDDTFIKKAPWDRWEIKRPNLNNIAQEIDQDELDKINWANNRYNKVELEPLKNYIYNAEDGVCLMKRTERGKVRYNTCRDENDRRPLSKEWHEFFEVGDVTSKIPTGRYFAELLKQKKPTDPSFGIYPIQPDGTIGYYFEESRNFRYTKQINEDYEDSIIELNGKYTKNGSSADYIEINSYNYLMVHFENDEEINLLELEDEPQEVWKIISTIDGCGFTKDGEIQLDGTIEDRDASLLRSKEYEVATSLCYDKAENIILVKWHNNRSGAVSTSNLFDLVDSVEETLETYIWDILDSVDNHVYKY